MMVNEFILIFLWLDQRRRNWREENREEEEILNNLNSIRWSNLIFLSSAHGSQTQNKAVGTAYFFFIKSENQITEIENIQLSRKDRKKVSGTHRLLFFI